MVASSATAQTRALARSERGQTQKTWRQIHTRLGDGGRGAGLHGDPESPISAGRAQGRLAKGTKGVLWIRVCEESVSIYELCGGKMDL